MKNKFKIIHHNFTVNTNKEMKKCTKNSIYNTIVFVSEDFTSPYKKLKIKNTYKYDTEISITDKEFELFLHEDYKYFDGHSLLLNGGSLVTPGSNYIKGIIKTREEILCYNSNLYDILSDNKNKRYYNRNRELDGSSNMYRRAIYTPNVIISTNDGRIDGCISDTLVRKYGVNVLTCAEPEYLRTVPDSEFLYSLHSTIEFILLCAASCKQKNLFLYDFGVEQGADPYYVAKTFKYCLKNKYRGVFKKVTFIIPYRSNGVSLEVFRQIFN